MKPLRVFTPDDFARIDKKYFSELRTKNEIYSDPSFWYNNFSKAALDYGYLGIEKYKSDFQLGLNKEKPVIVEFLSSWDDTNYSYNDLTLCSSATSASLILLTYFKIEKGIENIFFETPCYFGSYNQANFLGYRTKLIPTYNKQDFEFDPTEYIKNEKQNKIIWITQPRFGIGRNHNKENIDKILELITEHDYLVIDEATEQMYPSYLNDYNFQYDKRIIKLRSLFKGMGINGPRLSYIMHGTKIRQPIQNFLENIQGSIDTFSLSFATKLCTDKEKYINMLNASNMQVKDLSRTLQRWCIGSEVTPLNLENGYIGSVSLKYKNLDIGYMKRRESLLKYCYANNTPVILGSNLKFARDNEREFIRINYFNSKSDLKKAIDILVSF